MAEKNVVFVALEDYGGQGVLEWVFDHFENGETKLMFTGLNTGSYSRRMFPDEVRSQYLPLCKKNKFEADLLMTSEESEETEIILELITKHGMTKLVTCDSFLSHVFNVFASTENNSCKMWRISDGELIWVSPGRIQDNLQARSLKENIGLLTDDKVFVALDRNTDVGINIIDWVSENYENDETRLIIICMNPSIVDSYDYYLGSFYLPRCRKLQFEAEVLKVDEQLYPRKQLWELITIHDIETLIINSSLISEVVPYAKNLEGLCNIFVIHGETKNPIYFRDARQIELLRKENDLHEEKIKLHLLTKKIEKLTSETPQSTNKLEKILQKLQVVNKRIHDLQVDSEGVKDPFGSTQSQDMLIEKLAIDEEKTKAHDKSKLNGKTTNEFPDASMQLETMKNMLAIEEEKRKKVEGELDAIKSAAHCESKQHEKTKIELLDMSMQLEIEKKKSAELDDELGKQKKLLEEESLRHQQSDSNSLHTFNQLHEARSFLEIEIKNLKKDLEKKGSELKNKDKLHYGPGMANFSYAELKEATNDFDEQFMIGEGGFGKVYRGIMHCTTVAIKILNNEGGQGEKEFNQEVKTLQKVRHPNLVTLIGACPEKGGLVYEFLPNGSLQDWLGNVEGRKSLSWKRRIKIASDTCSALIFLHHFKPHGIAHGDLKPANILLDSNFECKLSDLGICRELKLTDETTTPLHQTERPMGTRGYMDPTYNSSYEITTHNDVYAFGVILLQLITGQEAINIRRLVEDALENKTENEVLDTSTEWPLQVAKEMMQLGMRCIHMVKKNRPDLANEVWAELESMKKFASSS